MNYGSKVSKVNTKDSISWYFVLITVLRKTLFGVYGREQIALKLFDQQFDQKSLNEKCYPKCVLLNES